MTPYVITLHREGIFEAFKNGFIENGNKDTRTNQGDCGGSDDGTVRTGIHGVLYFHSLLESLAERRNILYGEKGIRKRYTGHQHLQKDKIAVSCPYWNKEAKCEKRLVSTLRFFSLFMSNLFL